VGAAVGVCAGAVGARWSRQFGFVVESVGWTLPWACASVRCGHNVVDRVYLRRYYAAGSCCWGRNVCSNSDCSKCFKRRGREVKACAVLVMEASNYC
jgi:hypothetical protein